MIVLGSRFRTLALVAAATASAVSCYMISLKVSAERSQNQRLKLGIARDLGAIRYLQAELGTRSRLPLLEQWNAGVLALSAPKPQQYLDAAVELATFTGDQPGGMEAKVIPAVVVDEDQPAAVAPVQTVAAQPAPRKQAVVTVAYQPATTEAPRRPALLQTASYPTAASSGLLGRGVLGEIREAAAAEAGKLAKAGTR